MTPDVAMIFAAGLGTRMRELTRDIPKPMVPLAGVPMIDRALDLAKEAGIQRYVVNTHYLAEKISTHLRDHPGLVLSPEQGLPDALETGGGLKRALPLLGPDPVFTVNPDVLWTGANPFAQLAADWASGKMAALLLLVPVSRAIGHSLGGDFTMAADGRLSRASKNDKSAFVYTGAQICSTKGLSDIPETRFSLNLLWDRMIADGTLFGCLHQGDWVSVGTPESLKLAEDHLQKTRDV
jgi:MurNAc alpha-1-phosphate uridylyltransferase